MSIYCFLKGMSSKKHTMDEIIVIGQQKSTAQNENQNVLSIKMEPIPYLQLDKDMGIIMGLKSLLLAMKREQN